jgi:flavodoxin
LGCQGRTTPLPAISPQPMASPSESPPWTGRERILLAYYSRTTSTQSVAHCLARELGATMETITEKRPAARPRPWWRCSVEALLHVRTPLAADVHAAAAYDLVVVGTPVWCATISSPVRSYLARHAGTFKNVAFFVTCGGWRPDRALEHMARVSRCMPRATLAIARRDLRSQGARSKIQVFVASIGAPSALWASQENDRSAVASVRRMGD